jgi:hypothetical protein
MLEAIGPTKAYKGTLALDSLDLTVWPGEPSGAVRRRIVGALATHAFPFGLFWTLAMVCLPRYRVAA